MVRNMNLFLTIGIILSLLVVSLGQPYLLPVLAIFASTFGLALFWSVMLRFEARKTRFWSATLWFFCVELVQLSWMGSTKYMGYSIFLVYVFVSFGIGIQFGFISLLITRTAPRLLKFLAISGAWVILEWIRIFPLSGFPWNPIGLCLSSYAYPRQMASLFGVYGLSFMVILTNLYALDAFFRRRDRQAKIVFSVLFLIPYLFGAFYISNFQRKGVSAKEFRVALVQTALLPEQKERMARQQKAFISPIQQWERVLQLFASNKEKLDLIVLPEAAISYGVSYAIYSYGEVADLCQAYFGNLTHLPPLVEPYAAPILHRNVRQREVTNAFIAQALANQLDADLIGGFDYEDWMSGKSYNAAFYFRTHKTVPDRYEKQILVPVGEYVPFSSLKWVAQYVSKNFGIERSFSPGSTDKVFSSAIPLGVTICSEEAYSHIVRRIRKKGAQILVNIANDAWFPGRRLPQVHLEHGKLRAVESGAYVLRSSNTGVTAIVDCFGRVISSLPPSEETPGLLIHSIPLRTLKPLYLLWGDTALISLSAIFFFLFWRKKLPK